MKILRSIRNNIFIVLFAALFSGMLIVSKHFVLRMDDAFSGHLKDVSIFDFHWFDVVAWLALTTLLSTFLIAVVSVLSKGLARGAARPQSDHAGTAPDSSQDAIPGGDPRRNKAGGTAFFLAVFAFLLIAWLPYALTFVPFGVFSDTNSVIRQAIGDKVLTNHHPVLYTFMWRAVYSIGNLLGPEDLYLKIFSALQYLVAAAVYAYYIFKLRRQNADRIIVLVSALFFAFVPLVPLYVASLWKDTLFCLALFAYTLWMTGVVCGHETIYAAGKVPAGHLVSFAVSSLLIIFLRNNGLYIFIASSAILLLYLLSKYSPRKLLPLTAVFAGILVFSLIITGPVYDHFGLNVDEKVETYGIPLQQIAYIDVTDGRISAQDQAFLDRLIPKESLKEAYNPLSVDQTKWHDNFDREFLNRNSSEFLKVYARLVRDNPGKAVKAYCLATFGFWSTAKTTGNGYVSVRMFYKDKMQQTDWFKKLFGYSIATTLVPRRYISYAALFWLVLLMFVILLTKRQYKYLIPFIPSLTGWATVMAATPVAFSLRYVYFLFLLQPIFVYLLVLGLRQDQ